MTWLIIYILGFVVTAAIIARLMVKEDDDPIVVTTAAAALGVMWPITMVGLAVYWFIVKPVLRRAA